MLKTAVIMIFAHTANESTGFLEIAHSQDTSFFNSLEECEVGIIKILPDNMSWQREANTRFVTYAAPMGGQAFASWSCMKIKLPE